MRKWSQPTQRNRYGQAPPPAVTLDGSAQVPKGTATWPTARRAHSEPSSCWAVRQMRAASAQILERRWPSTHVLTPIIIRGTVMKGSDRS